MGCQTEKRVMTIGTSPNVSGHADIRTYLVERSSSVTLNLVLA